MQPLVLAFTRRTDDDDPDFWEPARRVRPYQEPDRWWITVEAITAVGGSLLWLAFAYAFVATGHWSALAYCLAFPLAWRCVYLRAYGGLAIDQRYG